MGAGRGLCAWVLFVLDRRRGGADVDERRDRAILELLLESPSEFVVQLAPDGRVEYVSPSLRRTLGVFGDGLEGGSLSTAHALIGEEFAGRFIVMLELAGLPASVTDAVRQHHERLDGTGYPDGLSGDEISGLARVVAVADVVEAMSSHRPYRPAIGMDAALEEIEKGRGVRYDERVTDACLRVFRERGFAFGDEAEGQASAG